jgi:hypothetical protein
MPDASSCPEFLSSAGVSPSCLARVSRISPFRASPPAAISGGLVPSDYQWGTGLFGDIADIRWDIYRNYYVRAELHGLLAPLGCMPAGFLAAELREIESMPFGIECKKYEEIAAHLWRRSVIAFPAPIAAWEARLRAECLENAPRQLHQLGRWIAPERLTGPAEDRSRRGEAGRARRSVVGSPRLRPGSARRAR